MLAVTSLFVVLFLGFLVVVFNSYVHIFIKHKK
jgi:hypothetical protein